MNLDAFDKIAGVYDSLAKLVFGKSIQQAQICFLNEIPSQSKVLIVGGGSGWILQHLFALKPGSEIWYVEASKKMLELSKLKTNHSCNIHFIHGTEQDIPLEIYFDAVITNFYLDLFTESSLDAVLKKIKNALMPNSTWLATDFIRGENVWQKVLLKIMYLFFRIACGIEASKIPDWNQHLRRIGLTKVKSKFFFRNFIEATVYCVQ